MTWKPHSNNNPRKFKEKIELLMQKEAQLTANFNAAMRDLPVSLKYPDQSASGSPPRLEDFTPSCKISTNLNIKSPTYMRGRETSENYSYSLESNDTKSLGYIGRESVSCCKSPVAYNLTLDAPLRVCIPIQSTQESASSMAMARLSADGGALSSPYPSSDEIPTYELQQTASSVGNGQTQSTRTSPTSCVFQKSPSGYPAHLSYLPNSSSSGPSRNVRSRDPRYEPDRSSIPYHFPPRSLELACGRIQKYSSSGSNASNFVSADQRPPLLGESQMHEFGQQPLHAPNPRPGISLTDYRRTASDSCIRSSISKAIKRKKMGVTSDDQLLPSVSELSRGSMNTLDGDRDSSYYPTSQQPTSYSGSDSCHHLPLSLELTHPPSTSTRSVSPIGYSEAPGYQPTNGYQSIPQPSYHNLRGTRAMASQPALNILNGGYEQHSLKRSITCLSDYSSTGNLPRCVQYSNETNQSSVPLSRTCPVTNAMKVEQQSHPSEPRPVQSWSVLNSVGLPPVSTIAALNGSTSVSNVYSALMGCTSLSSNVRKINTPYSSQFQREPLSPGLTSPGYSYTGLSAASADVIGPAASERGRMPYYTPNAIIPDSSISSSTEARQMPPPLQTTVPISLFTGDFSGDVFMHRELLNLPLNSEPERRDSFTMTADLLSQLEKRSSGADQSGTYITSWQPPQNSTSVLLANPVTTKLNINDNDYQLLTNPHLSTYVADKATEEKLVLEHFVDNTSDSNLCSR